MSIKTKFVGWFIGICMMFSMCKPKKKNNGK